jgi:hypothetical protein
MADGGILQAHGNRRQSNHQVEQRSGLGPHLAAIEVGKAQGDEGGEQGGFEGVGDGRGGHDSGTLAALVNNGAEDQAGHEHQYRPAFARYFTPAAQRRVQPHADRVAAHVRGVDVGEHEVTDRIHKSRHPSDSQRQHGFLFGR